MTTDEVRYEVWTKVNDDGDRVYIGVRIEDGRVVAATNAYATADAADEGMYLYGEQAAWVRDNRDSFERVSR
jgi:hypothetical protein